MINFSPGVYDFKCPSDEWLPFEKGVSDVFVSCETSLGDVSMCCGCIVI